MADEETPFVASQLRLTSAGAHEILRLALAEASSAGVPMGIAVIDSGGTLIAFSRQDGAPSSSPRLAMLKARTAVETGMPTQGLWDYIHDDQELVVGLAGDPEFMVVGGGAPIVVDGEVVGAIGTSGGHYSDDLRVANAAVDAFAARPGT